MSTGSSVLSAGPESTPPFNDIARLMVARMSYEDPIRIAQLKLAEHRRGRPHGGFEPAAIARNSGSTS